jgi:hypothetical protein
MLHNIKVELNFRTKIQILFIATFQDILRSLPIIIRYLIILKLQLLLK